MPAAVLIGLEGSTSRFYERSSRLNIGCGLVLNAIGTECLQEEDNAVSIALDFEYLANEINEYQRKT